MRQPMSALAKIALERARAAPQAAAGFALSAAAAAVLAGAWFFELVLGIAPCPLCLYQRIPYYIVVPLGLAIGVLALKASRLRLARGGLGLIALVLAVGAGIGVYHAGIEWSWWQGPASCAGGGLTAPAADILTALKQSSVVRCDEAPWRFLGLSLAGNNALIAGGLALVAIAAARARA
jgi:disulfide bond formation protein DsbB